MSWIAWTDRALLIGQSSSGGAAGGSAVAGLFLLCVLLAIVASVFWIWMLIDCLTSSLPTTEKLIWVLVMLFTHLLGALIYFLVARGGRASRRTLST